MFNIETTDPTEMVMIDFGFTDPRTHKQRTLFQLPVLGQKGLPMGIASAFGIFYNMFTGGRSLTDAETASAWSYFIQTLADTYPDATRQLARLDETQLKGVMEHWVNESDAYDPKASSSPGSSSSIDAP